MDCNFHLDNRLLAFLRCLIIAERSMMPQLGPSKCTYSPIPTQEEAASPEGREHIFNPSQIYSIILKYIHWFSNITNHSQIYSIILKCIQSFSNTFNHSQNLCNNFQIYSIVLRYIQSFSNIFNYLRYIQSFSSTFNHSQIYSIIFKYILSYLKNIATGETSQAITPFHFFDNFNFPH